MSADHGGARVAGGPGPVHAFSSILFAEAAARPPDSVPQPDCFRDLNLDQFVDAVVAGRAEYDLKPFFHAPLNDGDAIRYRHEVLRDLQNGGVRGTVDDFAQRMRTMRDRLATSDKLHYRRQKQAWFLDAANAYGEAVEALFTGLSRAQIKSRGMKGFRDHLAGYVRSDAFVSLRSSSREVDAALGAIAYCTLVQDGRIRVRRYDGETDYSAEVLSTFDRFRQAAGKDYSTKFAGFVEMNHVEAAVLELVARLVPEPFALLAAFADEHGAFADETVMRFDREVQFYLAYLDGMARLARAGLSFCFPDVSPRTKTVSAAEAFDVALAQKLVADGVPVVANDFHLDGRERILVVSGPNQGGKTTFARMFGQLHYLARLGCPVPGTAAQLFLADAIFTHFEREEDIRNRRGKLQDDLVRIRGILDAATPRSVIVMNEIFTSTTLKDATFLSRRILERVIALDALGVCVTFIDELSSMSEKTVSMVSTVVPDDPALRTFKIVRQPADGRAHAMAIARKYRLTHDELRERLSG